MKYNGYDIVDGKLMLDNLSVDGSLDLSGCTSLTTLPDNLSVGGALYLSDCTSLTTLPDNLSVGGWLDLQGCTSLDYPIVHDCGEHKRSIWLDYKNKKHICMGCFEGTKKQAIKAIKAKYKGVDCDEYIAKVEECFAKYMKEVK
jgi:hypothetical protein